MIRTRTLHEDRHRRIVASIDDEEIRIGTEVPDPITRDYYRDIEQSIEMPVDAFDELAALVAEHRGLSRPMVPA